MSEIQIQKKRADSASASLQVTVPPDRVRQAEDRAVRYFGERARLPGFRAGKAPAAIVRKRFGEAIRQSVLEEIIRESWEAAKSSEGLKPVAEPHIHNLKFEDGGPIEFELHVDVRPDLTLNRMGGFKLQRKVVAIKDADVEGRLRALQEQKANWIPIEGERPAPGHLVRLDVATMEGGEADKPQPYVIVLGEGQAVPSLEEKVMTLLPGETADAEVKYPDDHPDEAKRGTARQVRVTLHEVKRKELPPLDEAFAREVGEFESLDALRTAIREDLVKETERDANRQVRADLLQQMAQANNVEAPASMVERFTQAYARAYEVPEARLEGFRNEFRPVAEAQVRRDLILDAVAEAQQLRATEAELDQRVASLAEARQTSPAQLYASLQKADRLGELERGITEEKIFNFLLSQSTVEEASA
jgi:trigger factor